MPLAQSDRIAFSLAEVQANAQVAAVATAMTQVQTAIAAAQALDTANTNLFTPVNTLINGYQAEYTYLDGNVRTTIVEQDFVNSANKTFQNHFFPNDQNTTVPALSATKNIWVKYPPFAFTYAVGLNYTQAYPSTTTDEPTLINAILTLISSATANQDIENTTGQEWTLGTCSLPSYTTEATCVANSGVWTPGPGALITDAAVVTLKTNLVTAVNNLVTLLNSEVTSIVTNDPNSANQTQNNAAIVYINSTLLPAINTWLGYPDFNPIPGSVTTYAEFYAYNPALLAPTKLYSGDLAALQTALNNRLTFITTRTGQLSTVLGSITQSVTDGSITASSGLYGQRFGFIALRLNLLTGSLIALNGLQNTTAAQAAVSSSITQNKNTYYGILPTSILQAAGNGSNIVNLVDVSFVSAGNMVYVMADNQQEIVAVVKSVNGNAVTLSVSIPMQYAPSSNGRLYRDLT